MVATCSGDNILVTCANTAGIADNMAVGMDNSRGIYAVLGCPVHTGGTIVGRLGFSP